MDNKLNLESFADLPPRSAITITITNTITVQAVNQNGAKYIDGKTVFDKVLAAYELLHRIAAGVPVEE